MTDILIAVGAGLWISLGAVTAVLHSYMRRSAIAGNLGPAVRESCRNAPRTPALICAFLIPPVIIARWWSVFRAVRNDLVCTPRTARFTREQAQEAREAAIGEGWNPAHVIACKCEYGEHYHVKRKPGAAPQKQA